MLGIHRYMAAVSLLVVAGADAAPPRAVGECAVGDQRTPVRVWEPAFDGRGYLRAMPDVEAGDVLYIEFERGDDAYGCMHAPADKLYSIALPDPAGPDLGGTAVNLRGHVQFNSGVCHVAGFFMNHAVGGLHQGWTETYFEPLELRDVVVSSRFCVQPDAAAEAVAAMRPSPALDGAVWSAMQSSTRGALPATVGRSEPRRRGAAEPRPAAHAATDYLARDEENARQEVESSCLAADVEERLFAVKNQRLSDYLDRSSGFAASPELQNKVMEASRDASRAYESAEQARAKCTAAIDRYRRISGGR